MRTFSLQSGSNGNAIYVEAGEARLLFDAGISGRCASGRMHVHGRDIRSVDAVIISHDHNDHVRSAGVYHRMYKLPLHMTRLTHHAIRCELGLLREVSYFQSGTSLRFRDVVVHTITTPHDAADGVAFVVEHAGKRLGILTDLGHVFPALGDILPTLDALYLESNYDPEMLANGPYPPILQERIRGAGGHLSNAEAAELVRRSAGPRVQWVALAHLSEENNHPDLAIETHIRTVGRHLPLTVASRYDVSPVWEV
jgi:phosphoribosyl 1,2-cyclic phosphodiesterase